MGDNVRLDPARLPHACILSSPSIETALRRAREIAAAAVCRDQAHAPCGRCPDCRKATAGIHPDIMTVARAVDDKGKQRREITVEQISFLTSDAFVLPNESERKVYIIAEADTMNIAAQNKALKLLEEPPSAVIFLLCVTNAAALLPTVRSRCAMLGCQSEAGTGSDEQEERAKEYLAAVEQGDEARLCRWCAACDSLDNAAAMALLQTVWRLTADRLCRRSGTAMSDETLMRINALMERCMSYLRSNVGVKHIFGLLAVESVRADGNRGS